MSNSMRTKGFIVTITQLENKMKSLERSYKNMITNNKQTGRGRMTCPYQTELTELLGHKHNIEPVVVSGRNGLVRKNQTSTSQLEEIDKELTYHKNNEPIQNVNTDNENISAINNENLPMKKTKRNKALQILCQHKRMRALLLI
ncbi:uncharacterized protein [Temnothorax nylanderi]|uniref:uncharacterized protein n=1 Tax=Temnothorax nylanderi TaxID=102681 RepID=UPI003A866BE5